MDRPQSGEGQAAAEAPASPRRVRLSVRALMALVCLVALALGSAERLFVGDGGVDIEIVNVTDRPIHGLRMTCRGRSIAVDVLRPGASVRGRLWPALYRPGGKMDASFSLAYSVDGQARKWTPSFTFNLLAQEPGFRLELGEKNGEDAWDFRFANAAPSPLRQQLRRWWFWAFRR